MIGAAALEALSQIVGSRHLITHQDALKEYSSDGTKLFFMPDAVIFPKNNEEISQILQLATQDRFPVIPRGAGSGMSGGALPIEGGVVLSLDRLNRILEIDQQNLVAKVEPGVVTADLQKAVEEVDLFYPPDPASLNISTIGGNVAECAGGLRAVKYGVTKDYVLGLTIVLPTGEVLKTGVETMKGVAGYDLTRLIVGSEGTLAIITAITLRLIPKPEAKKTMLAFFPDISSAVKTVAEIVHQKIIPTILEFMDGMCLGAVRQEMALAIPSSAAAMLLIEVDGDETLVIKEAQKIRESCGKGGALQFEEASDEEEAERLWEARRNISPSLYKLRPHKVSEDVVVPRNKLPELTAHLNKLSLEYDLPIPAFGHAGDGNIHVNILFDKEKMDESEKVKEIVTKLFKKVIQLGGTISGEHGIGITKAPYLSMEISEAGLMLMSRIKKSFDPMGILNPGKMAI